MENGWFWRWNTSVEDSGFPSGVVAPAFIMAFQRRLMFLPSCLPKRPLRLVPYLEDGTKSFSSSSPIVLMCMSIGSLTLFPKQVWINLWRCLSFSPWMLCMASWLQYLALVEPTSSDRIGRAFLNSSFCQRCYLTETGRNDSLHFRWNVFRSLLLFETNWPAFGFNHVIDIQWVKSFLEVLLNCTTPSVQDSLVALLYRLRPQASRYHHQTHVQPSQTHLCSSSLQDSDKSLCTCTSDKNLQSLPRPSLRTEM